MKVRGFVFLLGVLTLALMGCSLPRRSEQDIRKKLLRETPPGTPYQTVLDYVRKQGWPVTEEPRGYEVKRLGSTPAKIVGKRTIKAYLGGYQGMPWKKDVECFWAFDEQDKLIDIFVEKQADAL
jgi:hypothetical protein